VSAELLAAAAQGRGLWIGMFPQPSGSVLAVSHAFAEQNRDTAMMDETDCHVTLLHLGKLKRSSGFMDNLVAGVESFVGLDYHKSIGVEGYLRLRKHVALALAPTRIVLLRQTLEGVLRDRDIRWDDRFEGIPHMTICETQVGDTPRLPALNPFFVHFEEISIVCGEARVNFRLQAPPF
jgi:hypothetical protein